MPAAIRVDENPPDRRRSSLSKSTASLQAKLSRLKINKDHIKKIPSGSRKSSATEDDEVAHALETGPVEASNRPMSHTLLSLPAELASQILLELEAQDFFALRCASVSFAALVSQHAHDFARHYFALFPHRGSFLPPSFRHPFSLHALYSAEHAQATAVNLAGHLADFVESEILRLSSSRARRSFSSSRARFISRVIPHLLILHHFYESWRYWMLQTYPKDNEHGWPGHRDIANYCFANNDAAGDESADLFETKTDCNYKPPMNRAPRQRYSHKQLRDAHQMYNILARVVKRMLRPPSYATTVEKRLRGWNGKSARIEYLDALLAIGGLDQARKLLSLNTLSARCAEVDRWVHSLQKAECAKWKENWKHMVHGPFRVADNHEASFEPPEYFAPFEFGEGWTRHLTEMFSETDPSKPWALKTDRRFLSEMLGRDLLSGTRWQVDYYPNDDEDEEET